MIKRMMYLILGLFSAFATALFAGASLALGFSLLTDGDAISNGYSYLLVAIVSALLAFMIGRLCLFCFERSRQVEKPPNILEM